MTTAHTSFCRNVRPCCHHQANEKANEALANEDYTNLDNTLAKCSIRSMSTSSSTLHIALNELGDVKLFASNSIFIS